MHSFWTGLVVVACFVALNAASAGMAWLMFTLMEAITPGFMRQPLLVYFIALLWLAATIALVLLVVNKIGRMGQGRHFPSHGSQRPRPN
ncbi:MAG: hypothetical protein LJE97_10720 [Betaproteobacteria bacterium]|nr:hypothetical protein [Betaproteobacteria bacterium]